MQKLGARVVDVHDRYIGLPTMAGHSKKVITRGERKIVEKTSIVEGDGSF